jgi:hypothetical protein
MFPQQRITIVTVTMWYASWLTLTLMYLDGLVAQQQSPNAAVPVTINTYGSCSNKADQVEQRLKNIENDLVKVNQFMESGNKRNITRGKLIVM